MAVPLSEGSVQVTVTEPFALETAWTLVGAEGAVMAGKLGSPPGDPEQYWVTAGPVWITPPTIPA